jgi:hypothetical protein
VTLIAPGPVFGGQTNGPDAKSLERRDERLRAALVLPAALRRDLYVNVTDLTSTVYHYAGHPIGDATRWRK